MPTVRYVCRCGVSRVTEGGMLNHLKSYHRDWEVKDLDEAVRQGLVYRQEEGGPVDPARYFRVIAMADKIMRALDKDEDLRSLVIERLIIAYPDDVDKALDRIAQSRQASSLEA